MKYFLYLNLLVFLSLQDLVAQTRLNIGEVAITSLDAANDSFTFITTKDIVANTQIYFTDGRLVKADSNALTSEGVILYTSPTDIPRGQVIKYGRPTALPFTGVSGSFILANGGDNIITFQGFDDVEDTVDRFISAVGFTATMVNGGGTNAVQGLTEGLNLLTINEPNGYYQDDSVGQASVISNRIHQLVNWQFSAIDYIKNFQFNTAPTLDAIIDTTLREDTDTLKVVLRGIRDSNADSLFFNPPTIQTVSGDNLFSASTIEYVSPRDSAILKLPIIPNANGISRITLSLRDTGENFIPDTTAQNFQVTLASIPDQPAIPPQAILEDSNVTIFVIRNSVDKADVSHFLINNIANATLKVGAAPLTNNQYGTITNDTLKILVSPLANFTGLATFSASGAIGASNTFLGVDSTVNLRVIDVGDSLSFSPARVNFGDSIDITITRNRVDSDSINTVVIDNITDGRARVGSMLVSNGDLLSMTDGKLIVNFKPTKAAGYFTVLPRNRLDGRSINLNHRDTVKITSFNTAPDFKSVNDTTLREDTDTLKIVLRGIRDSNADSLFFNTPTLQVVSGDNLFSASTIEYISPRDSAILKLPIVPNANGLSSVRIELRDSSTNFKSATTTKTFQVTINSIPDQPAIPPRTILEDSNATIFVIRNSVDKADVSHFLINNIANATLKVGANPLTNNQYGAITNDTLKILVSPLANFTGLATFSASSAIGASNTFLGVDSTVNLRVIDVGDSLSFSPSRVNFGDSVDITITRNRVDSDSINTVVIDNITGGRARVGGVLVSNGDLLSMTGAKLIVNFKPSGSKDGYFTIVARNKLDGRSLNLNYLDTVKIEVNSVPTIRGIFPDTLFYDFGQSEDKLLLNLSLNDVDNFILRGARIFFLNNYDKSLDILKAVGNAKVSAAYNTDLGLLEFEGFDSLSRYVNFLKTTLYSYGSQTVPSLKIKDLGFQVQDSVGGWSDTVNLTIYLDRLPVLDLLPRYCINDANMVINLTSKPRGIDAAANFARVTFRRVGSSSVITPRINSTASAVNIPIGQFSPGNYIARVIYRFGSLESDASFSITIHDTATAVFEASESATGHNAFSNTKTNLAVCANSGTNIKLLPRSRPGMGTTAVFQSLRFPAAITGFDYNIKSAFDAAVASGHTATAVLQDTIINVVANAQGCINRDTLPISINPYTDVQILYFDPLKGSNVRITDTADFCIDHPSVELLAGTLPKGGIFRFDTARNKNTVDARGRLDSATFNAQNAQEQAIKLGNANEHIPHAHPVFHRYSDRNDCSAVDTIFLNVNPLPRIEFDIAGYDSCINRNNELIKVSALRGKVKDTTGRWNYKIKKSDNTIVAGPASGIGTNKDGITLSRLTLALEYGITNLSTIDTTANIIAEFIDTETSCSVIDSLKVSIKAAPNLKFRGTKANDSVFCANDPPITLTATYPGFTAANINTLVANIETKTGIGLSGTFSNPFSFFPQIAMADSLRFKSTTTHRISFRLTPVQGCEETASRLFTVHALPRSNFKIEDNCSGQPAKFMSLASPPAGGTIVGWQWEFGDGTNSNLENPSHTYASSGIKNVKLTATTNNGCTYDTTISIIIGTTPQVAFASSGFTVNTDISFNSQAINLLGDIDSLIWDFGDGTVLRGDTSLKTTKHSFSKAGVYNVSLTVFSEFECSNTVSKTMNIFKSLTDYPYSQNFQDTRESEHGWLSGGINPSWQLRNITGLNGNYWASDIGGYSSQENSQVVSPIFDFSTLKKPMLIFDLYLKTSNISDGLVLQSSVDNLNWETVGGLNDSINWYNASGLSANPGNQPTRRLGWSGSVGLPTSPVTVRYPLDKFIGRKSVQFRFVFASVASSAGSPKGHFFVGNFFIRDRARKILFENFSDFSTTAGKTQDNIFEQQFQTGTYRSDLVVLQYPTRFNRSLNNLILIQQENITNARAFYYGIDQNNISVVGGNAQKSKPSASDIQRLIAYSLYDPVFEIKLNLEGNNLKIKIKPLEDLNSNMTLFVVSKEEFITKTGLNRDTIKHFVNSFHPNIAGLNLKVNWEAGVEEDLTVPIHIDQVEKIENVSLVVFIQNNATKEVYQVESLRLQASNNNLVTSTAKTTEPVGNFKLYPNPTSQVINIKFENTLTKTLPWKIYDLRGGVLKMGAFQPGAVLYPISLADTYAAGIYILEFVTEDGQRTTETFILTR